LEKLEFGCVQKGSSKRFMRIVFYTAIRIYRQMPYPL
jgi:hypothetical protein